VRTTFFEFANAAQRKLSAKLEEQRSPSLRTRWNEDFQNLGGSSKHKTAGAIPAVRISRLYQVEGASLDTSLTIAISRLRQLLCFWQYVISDI
jgi:hypothetical protein